MKTNLIFSLALLTVTPLFAVVDQNNNSLSDVYEFIYFGGPTAPFADSDGDGVTTYDEMFWGTNPTNAASKVTGPTMARVGNLLQFTWPAAAYRTYELRASEDLVTWQTLTNGTVSAYSENLAAPGAPSRRFYRLRVALDTGTGGTQPALITATRSGPDLILSWTMVAGQVYDVQSSTTFTAWDIVSTNAISPYVAHPNAPGASAYRYYRLRITGSGPSNGLAAWENALWQSTYGQPPQMTDIDGDGLPDDQEFLQSHNPGKKDHPAVGLVLFTPLEK